MPKTITEEILEWSENFLEIPSKKLGGWSVCPYARAARLKNEVKIIEVPYKTHFLFQDCLQETLPVLHHLLDEMA